MRAKTISKIFFEGPAAGLMAKHLEHNRDAEAEAIDELAPGPSDHVLAIGFGPGIGIELLADKLSGGRIAGVDPSKAMVKIATKRNLAAIDAGRVELVRTSAESLPWNDATFDGVITVNTIQLWDPFVDSVAEVARVMRPGARLVSFTHDWAIERFGGKSIDAWVADTASVCARYGLTDARHWRGKAEGGRPIAFVVRKGG